MYLWAEHRIVRLLNLVVSEVTTGLYKRGIKGEITRTDHGVSYKTYKNRVC